jgi:hypothetical protein
MRNTAREALHSAVFSIPVSFSLLVPNVFPITLFSKTAYILPLVTETKFTTRVKKMHKYSNAYLIVVGRDSSVGIVTCYCLDGPGIESRPISVTARSKV